MLKHLSPLIQKITGKFGLSRTGWTIRTLPSGAFKIVRRRVGFGPAKDHPAVLYCQEAWNLLDKVWSMLTRDQKAEWGICAKRSTTTARSGHDEFKSINLNRLMLQMPGIISPPDAFQSAKLYQKTDDSHPDIPPDHEIPVWHHGKDKGGDDFGPGPPDDPSDDPPPGGPIAEPPGAPYPWPPPLLPDPPPFSWTPCITCGARADWTTPICCCRLNCSNAYDALHLATRKDYDCTLFSPIPPSWAYNPIAGLQNVYVFCHSPMDGTYDINVRSSGQIVFIARGVKIDCNLCGGLKNKIWIDGTRPSGGALPPRENYWAYIIFTDYCPLPPPPPNHCAKLAADMAGKSPGGWVRLECRQEPDHWLDALLPDYHFTMDPAFFQWWEGAMTFLSYDPETVCWTYRGEVGISNPAWSLTVCCNRVVPGRFDVAIRYWPLPVPGSAPGPAFAGFTFTIDVTDEGSIVGGLTTQGRTFWDINFPFFHGWGHYFVKCTFYKTPLY